jgi:general secretion pathway protein K
MKPALRNDQRGVALLTTLMAVALMTLIVVDFMAVATNNYRSAANQTNELRAGYLARSGLHVGLALLAQDARLKALSQQPAETLQDPWAKPFPPIPVGGGTASVAITDEAGKLNINQLVNPSTGAVNPEVSARLSALFANAGVSTDIIPAIIDWLDHDSVPSQGGAEADYYLKLAPPYEPRNGPMPTIGDLRLVRGIDETSFARLNRMLTVAPVTQVNVNTAPPEVLGALLPEMRASGLPETIVAVRAKRPFKTVLELNDIPGFAKLSTKLTPLLTTRSDYFTIAGRGTYAGTRKQVFAMVRRNVRGPAVQASWRED